MARVEHVERARRKEGRSLGESAFMKEGS